MGTLDRLREKRDTGVAPLPPQQDAPSSEGQPDQGGVLDRLRQRRKLATEMERPEGFVAVTAPQFERVQAAQIGQDVLGSQNLELATRADLGLSDTFEEKRDKFKVAFPDGDLIQSEGLRGVDILFRRNPDEPFAKIDKSILEAFEPFGDLADITGDLPSIALEALTTKGGGALLKFTKLFSAGATGEALKQGAEELRGFQKDDLAGIFHKSVFQGAAAVTGAGLSPAVSGPLNYARGARFIHALPTADKAKRLAGKLDIPPLMPQQVSASPLVQKLAGQAGAVLSTVGDYVRNQERAVVQALGRLRDRDVADFLVGDMEKLMRDATKQIIEASKLTMKKGSEGGRAIRAGIAEFDDLMTASIDGLYNQARAKGTPVFDTAPLVATARELAVGVPALGAPRRPPEVGDIAGVAARALGADVEKFTKKHALRSIPGEKIQLAPVQKELASIIGKIQNLDPTLPTIEVAGKSIDAVTQLRALRSQLYDLKKPGKGDIMRQEHKQAARLFGAVNDVLKNPGDASPEFLTAWARANTAAAQRFNAYDQLAITQSARNQSAAELANQFAQPRKVEAINTLQDVLPTEKFEAFREGVLGDWLSTNNLKGLPDKLRQFDKETLDAIFTPEQLKSLDNVADQVSQLNNIGIPEILAKQDNVAGIIEDLVIKNDSKSISALADQVKSLDSTLGKRIRSGLLDRIYKRVIVETPQGTTTVNKDLLAREIATLKANGATKFLKTSDLRTLKEIEFVSGFLPKRADSGTSLQAGEAVAGIREGSLGAIKTLVENYGVGRLITSKLGAALLSGSAKEIKKIDLKLIGAILAQLKLEFPEDQEQ